MRFAAAIGVLALIACSAVQEGGVDSRRPNGRKQKAAFPEQTRAPERKANVSFDVVTLVGISGLTPSLPTNGLSFGIDPSE